LLAAALKDCPCHFRVEEVDVSVRARLPGSPKRIVRTVLLILFIGLAGACLGSIANAYWLSAGSGHGSAATTTAAAIVLSSGSPTASLYAGGHTDVVLTASNPNRFVVRIGSLALDASRGTAGFTVDAGHSGCAVSALSFATQTNAGAGWSLPARVGTVNGSLLISLADSLTMDIGAANACQGAVFSVAMAAGP
jgi:hypothetical protein